MFTEPVKFYLVKSGNPSSLDNDLQTISEQLGANSDSGYGIKKDKTSITISYNGTAFKSTLTIKPDSPLSDTIISSQMILTCEKDDSVSLNLLKGIVKSMGYRIYNPTLASFSTTDPNLMDLSTAKLNAEILKIFLKRKMVPIYRYINSLVFYAMDQDKNIHLVNRHLLQYAIESKTDISKAKNFSVKICSDLATFVALADRGIAPKAFYHALHTIKGDVLHINLSGFSLNKVDSDLYLSPVYFILDRNKQQFLQLTTNKNLTVLSKIKKGTSLKNYAAEVLKKHKIERLIAVKYPLDIEFYKEKTGELIPRMNISIFVDES